MGKYNRLRISQAKIIAAVMSLLSCTNNSEPLAEDAAPPQSPPAQTVSEGPDRSSIPKLTDDDLFLQVGEHQVRLELTRDEFLAAFGPADEEKRLEAENERDFPKAIWTYPHVEILWFIARRRDYYMHSAYTDKPEVLGPRGLRTGLMRKETRQLLAADQEQFSEEWDVYSFQSPRAGGTAGISLKFEDGILSRWGIWAYGP